VRQQEPDRKYESSRDVARAVTAAGAMLEETLHCLALVARCRSAAVIDAGTQRVLAAAGDPLDETGLRIASSALRLREPLWIEDASRPNAHVRVRTPLSVAVLPVRAGDDGSPRALVLVRDGAADWPPELHATVEAFVRIIDAAAPAHAEEPRETTGSTAGLDVAQALVDSLSELAWMKDTDLRFVAVNESLARLLHRSADEILGKTDFDFFPEDVAAAYREGDAVVLRDGQSFSTLESIVDGAGVLHWIETSKTPVRDERGTIIAITGVARDVTARQALEVERRRLLDELAQEQIRLHDMIANVPGVVWEEIFDGSRYVSDQVETLLGYTAEEYAASVASFMDLIHDDDRKAVEASNATIIASGHGGVHAFRMRRKDGTYVWCESHCSVIKDAAGQVIGLRGVSIDISLRHEAEQRLRASEQRFRDLANVTPVMIFTTNASGGFEFQNRRLLDFAAPLPEELNDGTWRKWIHPEDRDRVFAAWKQAHERRRWLSLEMRYRRHDGEYRDLLVEATPRYAGDGSFAGFAGTCVDLTDRRRLEHRLEQERQLTSLGRLAATIAHEINNVLMGIQPFADVIRRPPSPGVLERAAGHITNSVQRGRRITHEILRFAKTSDPVLQPVELRPWLDQIGDELQSVLGPAVELVVDMPDSIRMLADRHQMTQVLTNLAANSRDAMSGNGTFTIQARLERSWSGLPAEGGSYVHLIIGDSGPGIPAEVLDHIFEPLFTTKQTGTGLGLAIVRDVIRRHHGDVLVENADGAGATFHLIVPATEERAIERCAPSDSLPELVRRVLLVEDDEMVAVGIAAVLTLEGVQVEVATRGADAARTIEAFQPDVVVLDIGLPDVSGTVVFAEIRERWPELPVLFSTGHAGERAAGVEDLRGPTAHLLKPYEFNTLVAAVRRLVADQP
jgi:PAS domain S-box-containing protein